MLNTLQIILILQGLFLVFVLFKKREQYKKTQFWLLIFCILSIVLYTIGDDDNHLFLETANWFLFDSSLFITFLFLFIVYYNSGREKFLKKHYLFFIPNLIFLSIEIFELITSREPLYVEISEFITKLIFLSYLVYTIYLIITNKAKRWFLYFIIPITIILSIEFIDEIFIYFNLRNNIISEQSINFYFLLIVALLFYFMTFYLINSSDDLLSKKILLKYKNSNLSSKNIETYKEELIAIMQKEKLYLDKKLTITIVSKELEIPKQYISEVLNIHMNTSFQDFVNSYRVDAFINCLENKQYKNYSLLGIANEVGFNSKSSFNATFKKFKGLTPSQFQKSLSIITKISAK